MSSSNGSGRNANDNRGGVRDNRANERVGHDANDDRNRVRGNDNNERPGHDANDDNDKNKRRHGGGG